VNIGDGDEGGAPAGTEYGTGTAARRPGRAANLGPTTRAADRPREGRRAGRRCAALSEIDAEIKTLEAGFANVIYLATER
jgi:hypothetical protein